MTDAETRVVCHRNGDFVLAEDILQVTTPLAKFHVDDDVLTDGQVRDRLLEVFAGGPECDGLGRKHLALVAFGGAADDQQIDGIDDFAAAEGGCGLASDELRFVRIEVKHLADPIQILACQRASDALCDAVTDRVGMPDSFSLNDFDFLIFDCLTVDWLDPNVPLAHYRVLADRGSITCGNRFRSENAPQ